MEAVNPWELEVDPDFERTEDEIKRDQEAEQRALRAAAIAMRRWATDVVMHECMHCLWSYRMQTATIAHCEEHCSWAQGCAFRGCRWLKSAGLLQGRGG